MASVQPKSLSHGGFADLPQTPMWPAPSPADFEAIVAGGRPVVLKGLIEAWPALAAGRRSPAALNHYLKALADGAVAPVMEAPPSSRGRFAYGPDLRELTFTTRTARVGDTLDRLVAAAPVFVAIQMLPLATQMPGFVRENPAPLPGLGHEPRLWIGGPVVTQTHNDRDHNLACVIAGARRFLLFPPEQVANLYVGPLDRAPPLSLVDPEAPDLVRFPRFAEALAAAEVAWLEPGDALFLPRHWWHHVTSLAPYNAMVNYWWGGSPSGLENPNDLFLAALLSLKDLAEGERAYWQAMFDTFVFGNEAGAAHIPEPLRGPLGRLGPAARLKLKRELLAAFNGGGA